MKLYLLLLLFLFSIDMLYAYFKIGYTNITIILNNSTNGKVIENYYIDMNSNSIKLFNEYRVSLNASISQWNKALYANMSEYIFNPNGSISNFSLIPSLAIPTLNGGEATITITYIAKNIVNSSIVAPREFEYKLYSNIFNFPLTASGIALPSNTKLNIIIPKGAHILSIYPLPDYPTSLMNISNQTIFSWYESEPLSNFKFEYIINETYQQEIINFFSNFINNYLNIIIIIIAILLIIAIIKIVK